MFSARLGVVFVFFMIKFFCRLCTFVLLYQRLRFCSGVFGITLGLEIELGGIDGVLPSNVGCGSYRRHGVEVGEGHPDCEDGVFLSEALRAGNLVAATASDLASDPELTAADNAREDGKEYHFGDGSGWFVHDEADGASDDDEERNGPDVEGYCLAFGHRAVDFGGYLEQEEGEDEGEDDEGHDFHGDGGERVHECYVGFGAHECEEDGREDGDGDVGDDGEGGESRNASTQHSGDDGGGGCCRAEDTDECSLRDVGAEGEEAEVDGDSTDDLH